MYVSCDAGIIGSDDGFTKDSRIASIPGAPFGVLVDNTSPFSLAPEGTPPTNPCPSTSAAPVYLGVQTQFVSVLEESQDCGYSFQPVGKFPPYDL